MADANEKETGGKEGILPQTSFASVIPMMEQLRRQKGPIDIFPGLPQSPRPPQQIKIERIMESCVFKSTLAGVLGTCVDCAYFAHLFLFESVMQPVMQCKYSYYNIVLKWDFY